MPDEKLGLEHVKHHVCLIYKCACCILVYYYSLIGSQSLHLKTGTLFGNFDERSQIEIDQA